MPQPAKKLCRPILIGSFSVMNRPDESIHSNESEVKITSTPSFGCVSVVCA